MNDGGDLRVTRTLVIPAKELEWRFSRSGGPGGQHVNTSDTRVELRFNIASSNALGPRQRARLINEFGNTVRVVASRERSQMRNREEARRRLVERIGTALKPNTQRRPTRPTKSAVERRLDDKRRKGARKQERRWRHDEG